MRSLTALTIYAAGTDLHSHIVLIPFVSAYLIYIRRMRLPAEYVSSLGRAAFFLVAGFAALLASGGVFNFALSQNDSLSATALSFVCLLAAGGFLLLGRKWMAAAAFPFAFLVFIIPLPDAIVNWLETVSKLASAEVAVGLFIITGTPVLRDGAVFQLPGIVIEVAQECSGIRSSWVLIITSVLASYLFLNSPWRRGLLVALVLPLAILRNGMRILVIGLLCVEIGPQMIHSVIHKHGGPLFFALSLIPFLLLLWWLRRGEQTAGKKAERLKGVTASACAPAAACQMAASRTKSGQTEGKSLKG
jgi:exosortase C (VPDSG-CTERM-specific)